MVLIRPVLNIMKSLFILLTLLTLIIVFTLVYKIRIPSNIVNRSYQSQNRSTIQNERFGLRFTYPTSLTVKALGPNSSQKQSDSGEQISGTVSPSYETYEFVDNGSKAIFYLEIFHENDTPLTVEGYYNPGYLYLHGKCDGRWLNTRPIPVETSSTNGIDVLEVRVDGNDYAKCYYLKNKNNNLIVLSSAVLKTKQTL